MCTHSLHLLHRFARVTEKLADKPEIIDLKNETAIYADRIHAYGLDDRHVRHANFSAIKAIVLLILRSLYVLIGGIIILPAVILSFPLFYLSTHVATKKAREAKAGSSVKIAGRDVMATWSVLSSVAIIPILVLVYMGIYIGIFVGLDIHVVYPNGFVFGPGLFVAAFIVLIWPYLWLSIKLGDKVTYIYGTLGSLWLAITHKSDAKTLIARREQLQEKLNKCIELYTEEFQSVELDAITPAITPTSSPSNGKLTGQAMMRDASSKAQGTYFWPGRRASEDEGEEMEPVAAPTPTPTTTTEGRSDAV